MILARTYWSFLLDDVFYYPVKKLSKELACPHDNYNVFTRLDGQCGIRRLELIEQDPKGTKEHIFTIRRIGLRVTRANAREK